MTDLLERRFSPLRNQSDDSNWVDVRRRARRPVRRIALVAALAVAAALLVAPAFGLGGKVLDVIKGSPAPPRVQTYFASTNQLRKQMFARAQAAGIEMHDRYSPVIASEVRGVAAIETADGPIYLWVGPTEDGGQCWLVEPHSGGCEPAGDAAPIEPEGPGWTDQRPNVLIFHIRVHDEAVTRVRVELDGADELSLPVVSGHALGTIPKQEHVRLRSVAGLNANGEVIAEWTAPD